MSDIAMFQQLRTGPSLLLRSATILSREENSLDCCSDHLGCDLMILNTVESEGFRLNILKSCLRL